MWQFLKDRFYGPRHKHIITSEAQDAWINLHFSDFQNVDEYNSTLHCVASRMKLCGEEITENDMIEKTLSKLHPRNLQRHREYRTVNYDKYYDLLSMLKVDERNNPLLMKDN
jgi:hypothetical protein